MVKKVYHCTKCEKTFSRKFNAERHNELKHNSLAIIYNKETNWTSSKRRTKPSINHLKNGQSSNSSNRSSYANTTSTTEKEATSNNSSENNKFETHSKISKEFNFNGINSEIKEENIFETVFKIFEKISPLIDEIDKQLSSYQDPFNKMKTLSELIIFVLASSNPVKALKEARDLQRSLIGFNKASEFIAISRSISKKNAQLLLQSIILAAPYSKNKFNKQHS